MKLAGIFYIKTDLRAKLINCIGQKKYRDVLNMTQKDEEGFSALHPTPYIYNSTPFYDIITGVVSVNDAYFKGYFELRNTLVKCENVEVFLHRKGVSGWEPLDKNIKLGSEILKMVFSQLNNRPSISVNYKNLVKVYSDNSLIYQEVIQ